MITANGYMRATKLIIPAARAIISKELRYRYELTETEIAGYLGVAQAAVSKYVKGRYSARIKEMEKSIDVSAIREQIGRIAEGRGEAANTAICTVCHKENYFNCKFSKAEQA